MNIPPLGKQYEIYEEILENLWRVCTAEQKVALKLRGVRPICQDCAHWDYNGGVQLAATCGLWEDMTIGLFQCQKFEPRSGSPKAGTWR